MPSLPIHELVDREAWQLAIENGYHVKDEIYKVQRWWEESGTLYCIYFLLLPSAYHLIIRYFNQIE
jgi:hypothetical protein